MLLYISLDNIMKYHILLQKEFVSPIAPELYGLLLLDMRQS